ncbi:MAG TPA: site-2 protease family protein [Thermodesulfovibrionales bacterium]|nr:site-2 protease family protein [Thermodesulfovibrionales bacterium]
MDFTSTVQKLIIAAIPILVAITFHEVAHGFVANKLGDPTAKMMGRLTLNPIAHIDPIGTIVVPVMLFILSNGAFIFGTAKPVPVNFYNLKRPRRDTALVSAAGPATNIMIAFISILLYILIQVIFPPSSSSTFNQKIMTPLVMMIQYSISFNIFIAAFNLFPVPPLDGGRIATSLLPTKYAYHFSKLEPYGILIVLGLWFTGIAHYIIVPIQTFIEIIIQIFLIPFGGFV